ncbi:MAG: PucR family transcriptional regulator [Nocardioides sp.]
MERDPRSESVGEEPWDREPRLSELLATVGPAVLGPVFVPSGSDPLVSEPVIFDADADKILPLHGGILLLVGGRTSGEAVREAIRQAGTWEYSAVVAKGHGDDLRALVEAAELAGVALLVTPDEVSWRHVDAVVSAATSATAQSTTSYTSVHVGDLFPLANVIAARVGAAVSIEDPQGNLLAYSNLSHQEIDELREEAILGRRTSAPVRDNQHYRAVIRAAGPVRLEHQTTEHANRLAVPVRAGSQLLGLIFAIDTPTLGEEAAKALDEAAKVTALHLLRNRAKIDSDRWSYTDILRSLLDGSVSASLAANQLGMPTSTPAVVLATALSPEAEDGRIGVAQARIIDLVSLYCESWHSKALCTAQRDTLYALLPVNPDGSDLNLVRRFALDMVSTVHHSAQLDIQVGIGSYAADLDGVPTSRRIADRVLHALSRLEPTQSVATVDDVRSHVVLHALTDRGAAQEDMLLDSVRRMIEHDAEHDTEYAATFLAYLNHFGDAAKASVPLHVHENTLRYRIRRGQERFSVDLTNPEERLVTWLQLQLLA